MSALTSVLYHNISSEVSDFERELNVSTDPEIFDKHIQFLDKNYDIVDLGTVLSGKLPRRPLLITFDDYYRSVLQSAEQVLKPRNLPSVFFINPSIVGQNKLSLDSVIAWTVTRHGLTAVCRVLDVDEAINSSAAKLIEMTASKWTAAERGDRKNRLLLEFPISERDLSERSPVLDESDLPKLASLGVEIGNHTASHVHCGALTTEEYADEIVNSKAELERMSGTTVRSFSVAYGHERDLTQPVIDVLRATGHEAIFLVHARSNRRRPAPDIWYRVSLHNENVSRLPGMLTVLPALRSLRHAFRR